MESLTLLFSPNLLVLKLVRRGGVATERDPCPNLPFLRLSLTAVSQPNAVAGWQDCWPDCSLFSGPSKGHSHIRGLLLNRCLMSHSEIDDIRCTTLLRHTNTNSALPRHYPRFKACKNWAHPEGRNGAVCFPQRSSTLPSSRGQGGAMDTILLSHPLFLPSGSSFPLPLWLFSFKEFMVGDHLVSYRTLKLSKCVRC